MYCGIDKSTNKLSFWAEGDVPYYAAEDTDVLYHQLNEEEQKLINSLSPGETLYYDGSHWWTEKLPRSNEEIDNDVEDIILLLAEILGTDNTEESDE